MADRNPSQEDSPFETLPSSAAGSGSGENETENAFVQRMSESLRQAFVTMAVSMGDRLGLFEYLAMVSEPQTSQKIATSLKYKERYVREWLGSMVCARILEMTEEGDERFWLPKHRHKALVGHNPNNVAHFMLALPMTGAAFMAVRECFKQDGPAGTDYSDYPEYHVWREARMKDKGVTLLRGLLVKAPGMINKLEKGIKVLEVGSSIGFFAREMAMMFPKSTIVGSDICMEEIEAAEQRAREDGVSNLSFQAQDCTALPETWSEMWDLVFAIDVYHDLPRTDLGFSESFRVLRKGGTLLFNDIALHTGIRANKNTPFADFTYAVSMLSCMPTSLRQPGGLGLGAAWGQELALSMLKDAGFKNPQILDEKAIDYMATKE